VTTNLHGVGAALAVMADRVVMYRSSRLAFTEVEYEGVRKYKAPPVGKPSRFKKKAKKRTAIQKYLQTVRNDYLVRFWNTVASRLKMKPDAVAKQVASGGFSMLPAAAVKNKVAHAIIDSITWTPMANVSREVKTVISQKKYHTVAPGK